MIGKYYFTNYELCSAVSFPCAKLFNVERNKPVVKSQIIRNDDHFTFLCIVLLNASI